MEQKEKLKGERLVKQISASAPNAPGIYKMLGGKGVILYIGKAKNLKKRVTSYALANRQSYRIQRMVSLIEDIELVTTNSELEAYLLESNLIKKFLPRFNILMKDDKSYPYIFIEDHEFPPIYKYRGNKKKKGKYFGPYPSGSETRRAISLILKTFLLRSCTDSVFANRTRPCLEYQIKRCSAPCVGKISKEDYAASVKNVELFLSGKSDAIKADYALKMEAASADLEYEKAAHFRDRIKALTLIQQRQNIASQAVGDADFIAAAELGGDFGIIISIYRRGQNLGYKTFFPKQAEGSTMAEVIEAFISFHYRADLPSEILLSHAPEDLENNEEVLSDLAGRKIKIIIPERGEKKLIINSLFEKINKELEQKESENISVRNLLEEVAKLFNLEAVPERIEVYDNSHIMGKEQVGAMIVAGPSGFDKNEYRRFNIKSAIAPGDDYGMMREVLTRRLRRAKEENAVLPDLVIIDGGKGQLSAVEKVFADLGLSDIKFICISKGPNRNAGEEEFHVPGKPSFKLPKQDKTLYYLQTLRDEAHRFAITAHRKKREKNIYKSQIDEIEGIGAKRKKALLSHFGSVIAIKEASVQELARVPGINRKTAETIYNYLHA